MSVITIVGAAFSNKAAVIKELIANTGLQADRSSRDRCRGGGKLRNDRSQNPRSLFRQDLGLQPLHP